MLYALPIGETLNGLNGSLVEVKDHNFSGTEIENLTTPHISNTDANRIAISNESEPFPVCPISDYFALKYHVTSLHVNLIKFTKGTWPILHNIGYCIYSLT